MTELNINFKNQFKMLKKYQFKAKSRLDYIDSMPERYRIPKIFTNIQNFPCAVFAPDVV
jgi:hypothetical protein